jgi:hypothetical protein
VSSIRPRSSRGPGAALAIEQVSRKPVAYLYEKLLLEQQAPSDSRLDLAKNISVRATGGCRLRLL